MLGWSANFINNPYDDYSLMIELLYHGKEVAIIYQGKKELEFKWYPHEEDLVVPLDWIFKLCIEAEESLKNSI